jgi:DNA repair exonuclease SbcCD ATPase subunit
MGMLKEYEIEREKYSKSYETLEILKEYSSPTKKGIQGLFIKVYMAQTLKLANELLELFFGGRLRLLPYHIGDGEFSIPCYSSFTGLTTDDVSHCSRSEKAMVGLAMSGALMMQGSSRYNIFKIDEIDEGLDVDNRMGFMNACNTICDILKVEQFFMISHTSELTVDGNIDIIRLRAGTELGDMGGNVICEI